MIQMMIQLKNTKKKQDKIILLVNKQNQKQITTNHKNNTVCLKDKRKHKLFKEYF